MKIMEHKKIALIIVVGVLCLSSIWFYITMLYSNSLRESLYSSKEIQFNNAKTDLELAINQSLTFAYGLRGFVMSQENDEVHKDTFDTYAHETLLFPNSIKNFSVAPYNIQRYVYPLEGNEQTMNHNLERDKRQNVREDVKQAMEKGKIVTSGPYILRQGGIGLVIRMPIFRDEEYWGLVNVVVDFDGVIDKSEIKDHYKTLRFSLKNKDDTVFWSSDGNIEEKSTLYNAEIDVVGSKIYVSGAISDESGTSYYSKLLAFRVISFLLLLILVVLIINTLNKNIVLTERVKKMIYYDQLTKLPNRRYLVDYLNGLIEKKNSFSIAFMDIDDFKIINDTLGHAFGDEILGLISKRLGKHFTSNTKVFRWGGDEFIIISADYEHIQVFIRLIKAIKGDLEIAYKISDELYDITVSFGVAEYPTNGESGDKLIMNADTALYYAKSSGKSLIRSYTDEIGRVATARFDLERQLHNAVENNELDVYFQPIISIKDNKVIGAEALLRWYKDGVEISPEIFIPLAEKNNLMDKINAMIIKKIKALYIKLQIGDENFRIHINIAATNFNRNLLAEMKKLNEDHNDVLNHIVIEIVEGSAISNFKQAQSIISELQSLGIQVALDDFGKGYSSLSYLILLGINTIKIDQAFILKLMEDSVEYKLVKSIINLAIDLELNIVAEGVETAEQLEILKDLSCDNYQGFLFSKAIPSDDFVKKYSKVQ